MPIQEVFDAKHRKNFDIVRDYYVSNNKLQGIYFLIYDHDTGETFAKFLDKDLLTSEIKWKRKSLIDSTRIGVQVKRGKEDKLVIESGVLRRKKNGSPNNSIGDELLNASRITFYLKPNVYRPN